MAGMDYFMEGIFQQMLDLVIGFNVFYLLMLVVIAVATYFIKGYVIMCIGRKASLDSDWMPYVPIARQVYQMRIAECPCWYILFFETSFIAMFPAAVLTFLLMLINGILALIFLFVYFIANRVFTFFYYQKYYDCFGFNKNTAWIEIVPVTFEVVSVVLMVLIAFSKVFKYKDHSPQPMPQPKPIPPVQGKKAYITGISGKYAGAELDITDGVAVTFGRSNGANIIYDSFESEISREHCVVRYEGATGNFILRDESMNGTYGDDGKQFPNHVEVRVPSGTIVYLGKSKKQSFRLSVR